jgi:hypothetical protein
MTPTTLSFVACLALVPLTQGHGQVPRRRILPEVRADVVMGETTTAHLAAGVHATSGTYFRLGIFVGAGSAWRDSACETSYRFELQGRFVLDPFRASRYGVYGIGGMVTTHDPFTNWQSRLVLGAGIELPAHGRAAMAVEAAFAGGFRISLATRRLPLGRR